MLLPDSFLHIKSRVHGIYILLIQLLPQKFHRFAEALEVNDFPLPQEFDHVIDVRIVAEPQDIIISGSGLLFWERIP